MSVVFGWEPLDFLVSLSRGASFTFTLAANPSWPSGIGIELRFSADVSREDTTPTTWPAVITGANAAWNIPAAEVEEVLDSATYARLWYLAPDGSPLLWMRGPIRAS